MRHASNERIVVTMTESDPHKPLRQDVRLLGELLGETLREPAGEAFFDTVEQVRTLAKARAPARTGL